MAIEYERFQRSQLEARYTESIRSVERLAGQLRAALELESAAIDAAHIHGASSSAVEDVPSGRAQPIAAADCSSWGAKLGYSAILGARICA